MLTNSSEGSIRRALRQLINRWEDWLFAADDAAAKNRGWQVCRPPSRFARAYRDPRWDLISACEACGGDGGSAIQPCEACQGRGTIRLDRADFPGNGAS